MSIARHRIVRRGNAAVIEEAADVHVELPAPEPVLTDETRRRLTAIRPSRVTEAGVGSVTPATIFARWLGVVLVGLVLAGLIRGCA